MDFDRVRGGKIKNIAVLFSAAYKLDLIIEEIAKCEVVCSNCHRIRTKNRNQGNSTNKPRINNIKCIR